MEAREFKLRSDQVVRYLGHLGDDKTIVEDARTSVRTQGGPRSTDRSLSEKDKNLISDLLAFGHASTLRGSILKVEVETTIAMQRQMRTHWVGNKQLWPDVNFDFEESDFLGFNDQSGKYARYQPMFYVPPIELTRMEVDNFRPMAPEYRPATEEEYDAIVQIAALSCRRDWETYLELNNRGLSREISRMYLPTALYVSGVITANLNAWFGLISKRIDHVGNHMVTKPQAEFQAIAEQVEALIKELWPEAHSLWEQSGRGRL